MVNESPENKKQNHQEPTGKENNGKNRQDYENGRPDIIIYPLQRLSLSWFFSFNNFAFKRNLLQLWALLKNNYKSCGWSLVFFLFIFTASRVASL